MGGLELARVFVTVGMLVGSRFRRDMANVQQQVQAGVRGIGGAMSGAMGLLLGGAGIYGLVSVGRGAVAAFQEAQAASARLGGVLRATGGAAGYNQQQMEAMASELQAATRISDESIMAAQAKMLTFKSVTGDTFKRAIEASLDLAEVGFGSAEMGAVQLGKALEDPTRGLTALRRVGVSFSQAQRDQIKALQKSGDLLGAQKIVLEAVEGQVKGTARAMAGTDSGQMAVLANRLDDVKEKLGAAIMPLFNLFNKAQLFVFEKLAAMASYVAGYARRWELTWELMKASASLQLSRLFDFFVNFWNALPQLSMAAFKTMWQGMKAWVNIMISQTKTLINVFFESFQTIREMWDALWSDDTIGAALSRGMNRIAVQMVEHAALTAEELTKVRDVWAKETAGIDLFKESEGTAALREQMEKVANTLADAIAKDNAANEAGNKIGQAAAETLKKEAGLKAGSYGISEFGKKMQESLLGDDKQAKMVNLMEIGNKKQDELIEAVKEQKTAGALT